MEQKQKTIGILTSGGDAPGMNAAVRSVVRTAINKGMRVYGVYHGYAGLIKGELFEMDMRSVSNIIHRGGTMLYTARCPEFREEAGVMKAKETCEKYGIDGMVIIGGDGSFRGAADLSRHGIPCVGLPGTIDNDIACTDYTIGYDTAMNTVVEMVDKIRDTCQSHDRCSVVEVMGRRAGYIAVNAGISCGAICIMTPEIPITVDEVIARIKESQKVGKQNFIVMVAEGVGHSVEIAEKIEKKPASNPERPFWVMYSAAATRRCATVWRQARWAIMPFSCWKKESATVWLVCGMTLWWTLIFRKRSA